MTIDEFLSNVASESDRVDERDVQVPDPALVEEMKRRGGMVMADYLRDPRETTERRTLRCGHRLGPPLAAEDVRSWQARFPRHVLPSDLSALLLQHARSPLRREGRVTKTNRELLDELLAKWRAWVAEPGLDAVTRRGREQHAMRSLAPLRGQLEKYRDDLALLELALAKLNAALDGEDLKPN